MLTYDHQMMLVVLEKTNTDQDIYILLKKNIYIFFFINQHKPKQSYLYFDKLNIYYMPIREKHIKFLISSAYILLCKVKISYLLHSCIAQSLK